MYKKTVKVKFVGFWNGFDERNNMFIDVLKKHYNIVYEDASPDYVFCSMFGNHYEYCNYDGIRIFYSGENYSPDFNVVDYAIGYDELVYGDRFFRSLLIPWGKETANALKCCNRKDNEGDLQKEKTQFCNLISGHDRDDMGRKKIFDILSKYKKVDSAGTYLNNMPDGSIVNLDEKMPFQSKYKFSIAFESVDMKGFFTEKIVHAFLANTIPVYLGDPNIKMVFNEKAFIDCSDYDNFEEVLKKIIEIDNDNELFYSMLREPVLKNENIVDETEEQFEQFLLNIFEQEKANAYRRGRGPKIGVVTTHEKSLRRVNNMYGAKWYKFLIAVKRGLGVLKGKVIK